MAAKKYNLNSIFKRPMGTSELISIWTDDYNIVFKPDKSRLLESHKVPEVDTFPQRIGT